MTTFAKYGIVHPGVPEKNPVRRSTEQAQPTGNRNRQLILFIGGSKDGQMLTVPFQDGGVCICIEMPPQVLLGGHFEETETITLPIHLALYNQYIVQNGRPVAVSQDLQLFRYRQEVQLQEGQLSGAAVHQLRATIRNAVAEVGGSILPPAIGQEDIDVRLLVNETPPDTTCRLRTMRGECWLVKPNDNLRLNLSASKANFALNRLVHKQTYHVAVQ